MKKRYKLSTVLVAALVIILLAGAALAATELRIFETLFSKTASPEASERVLTDLGVSETSSVLLHVEEAVYDGKTVGLVLHASPADPEAFAVLYGVYMLQENLEEDYTLVYTETGPDSGNYTLEGRKDGKSFFTFSPVFKINGENAAEQVLAEAKGLSDGSIRVWLQYNLPESHAKETVHCAIGARVKRFETEEILSVPEITFTLSKKSDEITYRLTPTDGNDHERVRITSAYITFSSLMGYLEIEYDYTPAPSESMGIDFLVYSKDGTRLHSAYGESAHLGNGKYLQTAEIETPSEMPECFLLKAKVIGEDKILTSVNCRATPESEVRIPSSVPESVQEEPIGLVLTPCGSWQGERFRLLEGCIREGRSISVSFAFDGEPFDIKDLQILYKDQNGEPFGSALTSLCIVKDGYYTLTETLDGNLWPYPMALEFTLNGETVDCFLCEAVRLQAAPGQSSEDAFSVYPLPAKADEALVFIREDDLFYHTRPGCGRESARAAELSTALSQGKTPCPACCE